MIRKTQELKLIQDRIDREEYLETLKKGFIFADTFINRPYLDHFTKADFLPVSEDIRNISSDIRIFQVEKVVFDKSEDISDKLMNVYNALYNLSITTAIILKGDVNGAKFYFATRSPNAPLAESILSSSLRGNFPGIPFLYSVKIFSFVIFLYKNFYL